MDCKDSISIIAVNSLHILSGNIHYKKSNWFGIQTKMLKDVGDDCIGTSECHPDIPEIYSEKECEMMIPYITVNFTCSPPGM